MPHEKKEALLLAMHQWQQGRVAVIKPSTLEQGKYLVLIETKQGMTTLAKKPEKGTNA